MLYTKTDEWVVKIDEKTVRTGLSDHAQSQLGDIVFLNLPQVGQQVSAGEMCADVESVKAVADIFSPATGVISAVNTLAVDSPELINTDPLGTWLFEVSDVTALSELTEG